MAALTKLTTGRLVNGSSYDGIDMVIKDLDLEPKVDAIMRDFLYPIRWKELSKETSSKILPCGDRSCWKSFIFQGKRYVENSKYQYSSLGHAISDISDDSSTAASARSSQKRCSSPTSYVLVVFPICGALSPVRADLSPPPKRIRDSDLVTDLEISSDDGYEPYVHREFDLGVDFKDNYEPYTEPDIDSDIDECIAYAAAIRAGGMDDRDVVETVA
ncbi:hypothetical protein Tco_1267344 [Tanacetum coccineum]